MYCGKCGAEMSGPFCSRCGAHQDTGSNTASSAGYDASHSPGNSYSNGYYAVPMRSDGLKKDALKKTLGGSLISSLLLSPYIGTIVAICLIVWFVLKKTEKDEDPIWYALLGGFFGVSIGAVLWFFLLFSLLLTLY